MRRLLTLILLLVALPAGGLFYPEAGWVHPPAL